MNCRIKLLQYGNKYKRLSFNIQGVSEVHAFLTIFQPPPAAILFSGHILATLITIRTYSAACLPRDYYNTSLPLPSLNILPPSRTRH